MGWRDRLLDASFRGARFKVKSADTAVGRRNISHQFVGRDKPYIQDLGQDSDTFNVEAYVIQNTGNGFDYINERDNLIDAIKREGSGILIHPLYGFKKVSVMNKASIREDLMNGGMASVNISFMEAGDRVLPELQTDFLDQIDSAINDIYDEIGDAFYVLYTEFSAYMDTTRRAINTVTSVVSDSITGVQALPTKFKAQAHSNLAIINSTSLGLIAFGNDVYNAVKDSADMFSVIAGLAESIRDEHLNALGFTTGDEITSEGRADDPYTLKLFFPPIVISGDVGLYSGVARGSTVELDGSSVPGKIGKSILRTISDQLVNFNTDDFKVVPNDQALNVVLIFNSLKLSLLVNACRIGLRTEYFNQSEIIEYRQLVMDRMYELLEELGDESAGGAAAVGIGSNSTQIDTKDVFEALQKLINTFSDGMISKISDTAKSIDYGSPPGQSNCLSLAYDRYDDLDRMKEIFDENNSIKHPGFIPPSTIIRILDE